MWVTGWVRDRVSGREAAMGATIFVVLARQKWWGPVVLDAAPKPASHLAYLRESPPPTVVWESVGRSHKPLPYLPEQCNSQRRRGPTASKKEPPMARSKTSARDALKKLREQRAQLDGEEVRLRQEVAIELGKVLIDCGAETIDPAQLRQIVSASMTLGIEETLKRIAPA